jgi:Kef-type K+ transport system membrane component KefB
MMDMGTMTHYMGLLADNQPWNLIIFMAVPVICAETIAITELGILFTRNLSGNLRKVNKGFSIFAGLYFTGIFIYLMKTAYIPLTVHNEWKGWIDVVAVTFYLLGIVPLLGMALLDLGIIFKNKNDEEKLKIHSVFVGMFLVVAHVAMIFGMVDPSLGSNTSTGHDMMNM